MENIREFPTKKAQLARTKKMDFAEVENSDGVRCSWNVWPTSRLEATRMVIPFGMMYTPLKQNPNMPVLQYPPIMCKNTQCTAVLNPYWSVHYAYYYFHFFQIFFISLSRN
jgi:hypothetical protein